MTKQTIISFLIIIVVAVALFFGIRAINTNQGVPPTDSGIDSGRMMGKLPAGSQVPPKTSDVVGQTWVWKHSIIGGDAISAPNHPEKFTVTFGTDGKVSGTTDCNSFGGEYQMGSDGIISFGPFSSTLMFCEGSQEADFTGSLAQATRMTTDVDGNLVMILGETSNVMVLGKK